MNKLSGFFLVQDFGYNQMGNIEFSSTFKVIAGIALAAVAALILFILYIIFKDFIKNLFSKRVVIEARLVSKTAVPFVSQRVYAYGNRAEVETGLTEKGCVYKFFFEMEGEKKYASFEVAKNLFDVAVEGEKGMLDYKGTKFFSFDGRTEGTVARPEGNLNDFVPLNSDFKQHR